MVNGVPCDERGEDVPELEQVAHEKGHLFRHTETGFEKRWRVVRYDINA